MEKVLLIEKYSMDTLKKIKNKFLKIFISDVV